MDELLQAVEPFLGAVQEALPQVPLDTTVESFHFPTLEVDTRLVVPANTNLRDIARTGAISFSVAPTPTPPPENSGFGLIPGAQTEGDHPDSNHYPSESSQEAHQGGAGQKKLFAILKRHLRRYCASQAVAQKFPYFQGWEQEELEEYFSRHISISELEIESQSDIEMADLANYIQNYNRVKTLFDFFFESYLK